MYNKMAQITQGDDSKKTWRLLFIAILFALLAGLGTMVYLRLLEHRLETKLTPAEKQMVQVVVANTDLAVGSKVDTSTMSMRKVPAEYVNSDVITPDQFDSVDGAILTKPLAHGKMLSTDYFDLNIPMDFSGTVKLGHRAVTIQVGEINSVAGLIRPGNAIDLYSEIPGGSLAGHENGEVVIPVLEDVLVLATDKHSARPNVDEFEHLGAANNYQTYDTLTLEVTPIEAALLTVAESQGTLIATLRNAKDTGGVNFSQVGLNDLVQHSEKLLRLSLKKQRETAVAGVHLDSQGRLVTKNGTVITDPNVHLNKSDQLVTKDGTILSGRDLFVGSDGKIHTKDGRAIDTASLITGKDGTLVDKNGTILAGNGLTPVKGGFLMDKDGHILTKDGHILAGVTVGKDGKVRAKDGKILTADAINIGKDGKVYMKPDLPPNLKLDSNGQLVSADGKKLETNDLVTIGPDDKVRTKDGTLLKGVTVGKDGQLYSADGKKMSTNDILLASQGLHKTKDNTIVDSSGKTLAVKDLVDVGRDGKIRDKDGRVIDGAYVDANGVLRKKDGSRLTAADLAEKEALAQMNKGKNELITGVTAQVDSNFASSKQDEGGEEPASALSEQVEYIIGGSTSDGVATTFKVQVEESVPAQ